METTITDCAQAPTILLLLPKSTESGDEIRKARNARKHKKYRIRKSLKKQESAKAASFAISSGVFRAVAGIDTRVLVLGTVAQSAGTLAKSVSSAARAVEAKLSSLRYRSERIIAAAVSKHEAAKLSLPQSAPALTAKQKRAERKKGALLKKDISYLLEKHAEQRGVCPYCKRNLIEQEKMGNKITIDHVVPITLG